MDRNFALFIFFEHATKQASRKLVLSYLAIQYLKQKTRIFPYKWHSELFFKYLVDFMYDLYVKQ